MAEHDPTCIGRVARVLGSSITVRVDPEMAGLAPLWQGQLQQVGQIGSLLVVPQGQLLLVGSVTQVGIAESTNDVDPLGVDRGDRWILVQLLGEVDALGAFHRGLSSYPGLDDGVHFPDKSLLEAIYPAAGDSRLSLGKLSGTTSVDITLDIERLVNRHSAIVGSTGAGKTSAVARLLQRVANSGWSSANVIVIDPHGEYSAALGQSASVRSIIPGKGDELRVPFWCLGAMDLLGALTGAATPSATLAKRFSELVVEEKLKYATGASWVAAATGINADSPVPFDLQKVWYQLDYENRLVVEAKATPEIGHKVVSAGDAKRLESAEFEPYGPGGKSPDKAPSFDLYGTAPSHIRARLKDDRYGFFLAPDESQLTTDPLAEVVDEWLGGNQPVSVLNFSGVPTELADLAIGVILKVIFEISIRSSEDSGIGRNRPVLFVVEEAHRFLSDALTVKNARDAVNRIAREGRKYGVGLMLVTQRPSELPETAVSQLGTVISLRLTNSADQSRIRSSLPDSVAALADALPSLRTGEALIAGEAVGLPCRVTLDLPDPKPQADDPTIEGWRSPAAANNLTESLKAWRNIEGAV